MDVRTFFTYLCISRRMSIYMILCAEKILDLGSRCIQVNPALISGEAESIMRKTRVDEPVGNGGYGLLAGCKSINDLHRCKVLSIIRRLRMRNRHKHLLQPVEILLNETKTHWEHLVRSLISHPDEITRLILEAAGQRP